MAIAKTSFLSIHDASTSSHLRVHYTKPKQSLTEWLNDVLCRCAFSKRSQPPARPTPANENESQDAPKRGDLSLHRREGMESERESERAREREREREKREERKGEVGGSKTCTCACIDALHARTWRQSCISVSTIQS